MKESSGVAIAVVALALLDTTLAGFRCAAGRDGRIQKRAYYLAAMRRGFESGLFVCVLLGGLTALAASRPDGAAFYADLVAIGLRMLPVFAAFGGLVVVALTVYGLSRHEVRTFATVAILGPFTLARPWVIALATGLGVHGAKNPTAIAVTLLSSAAVLLVERNLGATFAREAARARAEEEEREGAEGSGAPRALPIEASIDLHFFAPRDIPSVVDEYLREAAASGHREVRLIHGRGKGVQRARVQKILAQHPAVRSFRSDGTGSTLATLRSPE